MTSRRAKAPPDEGEHGRGPRTAIAVAVASPLGVQPDINSAGISSSTGQPLGIMQLYSYALRPVLLPCLAVGRRRCRSPKAGDGELQKAAPESSFTGPSGSRCPHHINGCKTSEEVIPGAQCMCIRGYIYRPPPPACQYTGGVPIPPPREERRRGIGRSAQLQGQY
jgi:hypothetical protein